MEKIVSTTVAKRKPAGVPMPLPKPTEIGVLKSIAEIGADPVTVRKSTPSSPTACLWRKWTSVRVETSYIDALSAPVRSSAPAGTPPGTGTSLMPFSFRWDDSFGGHVDVLQLCVVLERMRPELAPDSRLLEATEGRGHADGRVRVDRDRPGLERARDPQRAGAVAGPDRARQPVDRVVGEPDRLGLALEGDHRGHRAEDLLARGPVVVRDRAEHGRREPVARSRRGVPADRDRRVVVDERRDLLALLGGDQRPHLRLLVERVADPELVDRVREQLEEAIERASLDEDPRARAAVLAGVPEHCERRSRRSRLEIRVGEDDVRRLSAQLERDALDRLRGELADPPADDRRPRERDLRDVRMLDQPLADDAPGTDDDVQHALRQAGLERDPLELERRQGCQLGGLEHDRVAGGERRRDLPRRDR